MRSVLKRLNDVVGVKGSLVVTRDGMVVAACLSKQLEEDIQKHVRGRLAPYEYPKDIEFIDALPPAA